VNSTENRIKLPDVKVTISFNGNDVYDASTQPFKHVSSWIHTMDTFDNGCVTLVVWDPENNSKLVNKVLTPLDITSAFARVVENGFTHCSGYPIQNLDYADACTSDLVLQQACYGEIIWG
jgi:hypothetical protein